MVDDLFTRIGLCWKVERYFDCDGRERWRAFVRHDEGDYMNTSGLPSRMAAFRFVEGNVIAMDRSYA